MGNEEFSEKAREALRSGSIKIKVIRSGMYQQLTFRIRKVKAGEMEYTELFTERLLDISEILRVANEVGLPVEAKNGKAFPSGTSAADFQLS